MRFLCIALVAIVAACASKPTTKTYAESHPERLITEEKDYSWLWWIGGVLAVGAIAVSGDDAADADEPAAPSEPGGPGVCVTDQCI